VRFSGWRVDGYGVFADHRIDDLPEGLTIVFGPNEAGKSTLLDFLRDVLFGFPDRRHRRPMHEPLRGGRHGGLISLVDAEGRSFAVERYAGARAVSLTGPDGTAQGEAELRRLLGGADAGVFRSVFAFGLGELASFDSLERDEVRELVFSAGVLGAGRSATKAIRALADRQAQIVRPRQQDALANRLRKEIEGCKDELMRLRSDSAHYPDRAKDADELTRAVADARRHIEASRMRAVELERLESSWPIWVALNAATDALRDAVDLDRPSAILLRERATVHRLAQERSGHTERVERLESLREELAGMDRSIADELAGLGEDLDLDTALRHGRDVGLRERVQALAEREPELRALARAADDGLGQARAQLRDALAIRGNVQRGNVQRGAGHGDADRERVVQDGTADEHDPLARARELRDLLDLVRDRDRLIAERASQEQADRLARLERPADRRSARQARLFSGLLVLVAVAVGAGAALAGRHHVREMVLLGVAAIVLLGLAIASWVASRRVETPAGTASGTGAGDPGAVDLERLLDRLRVEISELASLLGLDDAPSAGEVEISLRRALEWNEEFARRSLLDQAVNAAAGDVTTAERVLSERRRELAATRSEAESIARSIGLSSVSGPSSLVHCLDQLAGLHAVTVRRADVEATIGPLARAVTTWEGEVRELVERLRFVSNGDDEGNRGNDGNGDTSDGAEARGVVGTDQSLPDWLNDLTLLDTTATLDSLELRLQEIERGEDARRRYHQSVASSEAELTRLLGGAGDLERLRSELATGEVTAWQAERASCAADLQEATERYDELVRAEQDARRDVTSLERTGDIADAELRLAELEAQLTSALHDFAVAGLARSLVERTLGRYEKERQPAVVARAAELFALVTDGRYTQLVARADPDSGRSHGIDALTSTGTRVDSADLSRGTAEQLYLCLRLALATSFAGAAVTLPLILDDVLVNFDPSRARAVAGMIANVAKEHQVLAFTCHPHIVDLLHEVSPSARIIELSRPS